MEFLQPRKPPSDPGGGRPRTLTSEPPNADAAASDAASTASQSMRSATHLFDGSEDVDQCGQTEASE